MSETEMPVAPWAPERPWLSLSGYNILSLNRKGTNADGVGVWLVSEDAVVDYLNALEARLALVEQDAEALAGFARALLNGTQPTRWDASEALANYDQLNSTRLPVQQQQET